VHASKTGAEYGAYQLPIFRALDFADEVTDGIVMYNACTVKTAEGTCGLAYPSKLWWQDLFGPTTPASESLCGTGRLGQLMSKAKWTWKCHCEWGYLVKEAYVKGPESDAYKWMKELEAEYGMDIAQWPNIGCGGGFRACSNGPSMVIEVRVDSEEGTWEAFLSERLPPIIDDCIKGEHLAAFQKAMGKVSPDEIYDLLPMTFPKTHNLVHNGKVLRGISKYPIDEWMKKDRPVMTSLMWVTFVRAVAMHDVENLTHILDLTDSIAKSGICPR
jgi:hypothetical protein